MSFLHDPDLDDDLSNHESTVLIDASHRLLAVFPPTDRDAAETRMRDTVISLLEYAVDETLPTPPAIGTVVDPEELHWREIGRAIPGIEPYRKTPVTPLATLVDRAVFEQAVIDGLGQA